jgi:soluble lytic murein transglycosylase
LDFIMSFLRAAALTGCCAVALGAVAAAGQTPAPHPLPAGLTQQGGVVMMHPISDSDSGPSISAERRVSLIPILSPSDHDIYSRAFDAGDRGDWIGAKGLAAQGHNAAAGKLLQWKYLLDKNSGATFAEISGFILNDPDWPLRETLYARAEKAISPDTAPQSIVAFFGGRDPVTGLGKVRLGEALIATGSAARGKTLIQQGWIEGSFDPDDEADIIARHGDILTPDVDAQRVNRLLLRNEVTAARRELSRLSSDQQQIAQVRLQLKTDPAAGLRAADNIAASSDPGLLFDKVRAFRRQNQLDEAADLVHRGPSKALAAQAPSAWWAECAVASRNSLQVKNYRAAYIFAADCGLTPDTSTEYSEAQFLAGWIALRYLGQPSTALTHFHALARAVGRPISKARAYYWIGRAWEASGDTVNAATAYHTATAAPETFYGQLALAKIDPTPHLSLPETPAEATTGVYESDRLSSAIRVLADLGQLSLLRLFAVQDATVYSEPGHVKALCADLVKMGFRDVAVRVAKQASYGGIYFWNYLYPTVTVPAYRGNGTAPDQFYVHGIIRQETEFDPSAVSGPGARGLMQIMPSSGRIAATQAGLDFRPNDLTSDTTYNMQLGMTELGNRISGFGGSLVLAAAAYNAGPGNVNKWLDTYGDPRSPTTDPIDWIESIPFSETRNYVQRVLDNMEVYRVRLGGSGQSLQIVNDIYKPRTADIKVLHYTPAAAAPAPIPAAKPATGK